MQILDGCGMGTLHALPGSGTELLAGILKHRGWESRSGQVSMVQAIAEGIQPDGTGRNKDVVVKAPVGTGKTLGYLAAALAGSASDDEGNFTGRRIVIATSTKSLQDQIVNEELPALAKDLEDAYGYTLTYALLKGKGNYVCMERLAKAINGGNKDEEDSLLAEAAREVDVRDKVKLSAIAKDLVDQMGNADFSTRRLDAERLMVGLRPDTRAQVSASAYCKSRSAAYCRRLDMEPTPDNRREATFQVASGALGCVYAAAYAQALSSQIVVLNSTLLAAEIQRAEFSAESAGEVPALLHGVDLVIVDEAHHLPRILAEWWSQEVDFDKLTKLVKKGVGAARQAGETSGFSAPADFMALPDTLEAFQLALNLYIDEGEPSSEVFFGEVSKRVLTIHDHISKTLADARLAAEEFSKVVGVDKLKVLGKLYGAYYEEFGQAMVELSMHMTRRNPEGDLSYRTTFVGASDEPILIKTVPISVDEFRAKLTAATRCGGYYQGDDYNNPQGAEGLRYSSLVMCSGTIHHRIPASVGMNSDTYFETPDPFNPKNARIYIPKNIDVPGTKNWHDQAWTQIAQAIKATGGRTMVLTTSHSDVKNFTERAMRDFPTYEILSQGNGMSKEHLVNAKKANPSSILIGTTSFWEGVDIPGEPLSLVVITKFPFPTKDDPILEAQREYAKEKGRNPFVAVDVAHVSVMLAQGAGRAIRKVDDVAGVMLMDSRYHGKRYGTQAVSLLPQSWAMTSDLGEFVKWQGWVNPDTRNSDTPPPAHPGAWRTLKPQPRRK